MRGRVDRVPATKGMRVEDVANRELGLHSIRGALKARYHGFQ